ncbi:Holliday junction branch migration DNA helicase RuvB [Phorcysia thermohydrogeniphila]|uniref:Holliday junction branch migration complex subunit RuvB n=1 Tax=Phorcysia thermohydrogeniphila TaxID=936138 RepID=A0A4R1GDH2_9BACT|nr:Holliday junction branch migration DNA helicase RuvB [Phorcysia thermohydrogeniphila]TCK04635.1 Holliday junction DNA helicase subunit RuvB [Phorcysia thermohydrogeniphila]
MIERPESLDQFIGQEKVKKVLKVAIESAKKRGEPLDHVLFYGPPGTGKTTLSMIIAKELGKEIKIVSAPTIERKGDLIALITSLNEGDVLFIDEIHRLNRSLEESIYSAMEDFRIDIVTGSGSKRALSIELPRFTLIGATTRLNLLTPPFRSRFGLICRLELYTASELARIAKKNAEKLGIVLSEGALKILARSSRGTPRILNQLLKRFRDYATVHGWEKIGEDRAKKVLDELGIDSYGLDQMDRKILKTIAEVFKGGPVGLNTLAMVLKEDVETIANVHEPYLIEMGFIVRTPRGRKITPEGLRAIGYLPSPSLL